MSQRGRGDSDDRDDPFVAYSQGPQAWERLTARVIEGRIYLELDGTDIKLTKIQSQVLVQWLANRLE